MTLFDAIGTAAACASAGLLAAAGTIVVRGRAAQPVRLGGRLVTHPRLTAAWMAVTGLWGLLAAGRGAGLAWIGTLPMVASMLASLGLLAALLSRTQQGDAVNAQQGDAVNAQQGDAVNAQQGDPVNARRDDSAGARPDDSADVRPAGVGGARPGGTVRTQAGEGIWGRPEETSRARTVTAAVALAGKAARAGSRLRRRVAVHLRNGR